MKIIIEYGMITDEEFFERSKKFYISPNVDGKYFTFKDFPNRIKDLQKDNKVISLYASEKESQHSYKRKKRDMKLFFCKLL